MRFSGSSWLLEDSLPWLTYHSRWIWWRYSISRDQNINYWSIQVGTVPWSSGLISYLSYFIFISFFPKHSSFVYFTSIRCLLHSSQHKQDVTLDPHAILNLWPFCTALEYNNLLFQLLWFIRHVIFSVVQFFFPCQLRLRCLFVKPYSWFHLSLICQTFFDKINLIF